jgi:hypothetical protein
VQEDEVVVHVVVVFLIIPLKLDDEEVVVE